VTYDAPAKLARFATRRGIRYTLLADPDSAAIRAFGLLNEEYAPGSYAYGVAHPMILVFDAKGTVSRRFSSAGDAHYPDLELVLAELRKE